MWIQWKYDDHGFSDDMQELEVPDDFDGEESVEDWMCGQPHLGIPTWGRGRIKWQKLELSPKEIKRRRVAQLEARVKYLTSSLEQARNELVAVVNDVNIPKGGELCIECRGTRMVTRGRIVQYEEKCSFCHGKGFTTS